MLTKLKALAQDLESKLTPQSSIVQEKLLDGNDDHTANEDINKESIMEDYPPDLQKLQNSINQEKRVYLHELLHTLHFPQVIVKIQG